MDAAPLRLWIGALLAVGGIFYALFFGPLVGAIACVVGIAILTLGPRVT